jgi:hypothetical protein
MNLPHPRTRTVVILAVGLAASGLGWLLAAPVLSPRREEMPVGSARVDVDYATSASADDLGMPLYPGAQVKDSFLYRVKTPDGKRVLYYASAVLSSADSPDKVASGYQQMLPGRPQAEVVEGDSGRRYVLALAQGDEVKMITITEAESGSRIELVRATRPSPPPKPLQPRGRERVA